MKKVSLWQLFATFFKTGLFTFGGGYAMISILQEELVNDKKWITTQDMLDMIVVAESTPGVIAVNTATSVGYKKRGIVGAIIATLGVVLPSFLIISILSYVIQAFQSNVWYQSAFKGIQACVTVLVINAFVKMFGQLTKDVYGICAFVVALGVALFTNVNVIWVIIAGGVVGCIIYLLQNKKQKLPLEQNEAVQVDEEQVKEAHNLEDNASNQQDNQGGGNQ